MVGDTEEQTDKEEGTTDDVFSPTQRLKMRYQYVLGCLEMETSNTEGWKRKKEEVEEKLREKGIQPSTLTHNSK